MPLVATKTYNSLKNNFQFRRITKSIISKLRRMDSPIERARYAHKKVNEYLAELFEDELVVKHVSCKKSCAGCCHTQVSVTDDEAELLAEVALEKNLKLDLKRLIKQSKVKNDPVKFFQLGFEDRKCVFLNNSNECSVYEDRPLVCRTNTVVSAPENCFTTDGIEKPIRLLNTHKADMVIIGAFRSCKENGTLPHKLWELLQMKVDESPKKIKKSKTPLNNPENTL